MTDRDLQAFGAPPPFDPELALELPRINAILAPDAVTSEFIPQLRAGNEAIGTAGADQLSRGGRFTVEDLVVPGRPGDPEIGLLVCRPTWAAPTAIVYHVHGGGMVAGDSRNGIVGVLDWAECLALTVVSVDYRLAPETPHPGPVEDCLAGLLWTQQNAGALGSSADRVIVVGGSAGGGLAAGLTLLARDRGLRLPLGLMLLAPMLDDRNDTGSARQMAGVGVWDRTCNETGWTALLGAERGGVDVSPYAAPARAERLDGIPATYVDVGSAETFRDEAVEFASRIWAEGGAAELHVWPGAFHAFDAMVPGARLSGDARAARFAWLRRMLREPGASE